MPRRSCSNTKEERILMNRKERDSNMELLRIVAMIIIMLVHANFRALGYPDIVEVNATPLPAFMRYFSEGLCIMGVDVFVLLSGWYGIRMKPVRLAELLFQIFFFLIVTVTIDCAVNYRLPNTQDVGLFLMKSQWDYWFVKAYVFLYLLSPILNAFVEIADKKSFQVVLLFFFGFEFLWGWLLNGVNWMNHGNSGTSFIGLYLLARYLRIYPPKIFMNFKIRYYLGAYIGIALFIAFLAFLFCYFGMQNAARKMYYYTCPFVIVQAVAFLLFFSKFSFYSRLVNWIAISTFAIYLLHSQHYFGKMFYDDIIARWYMNETTVNFLVYTVLLVLVVFWLSIFLDKIRLCCWNAILKIIHQ